MNITVFCPAKVNLFLAVGPPDERGYHPLRTIFQAVSLFDVIEISDDVQATQFSSDWDGLPHDNTLTKTHRLYRELVGLPALRIHLRKRIPAQSGLGGGSSNAAGLLRGLQKFAPLPLNEDQLVEIAAAVGSDVPFFLFGGTAKGQRYGDVIAPLEDQPFRHMTIAMPSVGVSTAAAYALLDKCERAWNDFPTADFAGQYHNDFEIIAPQTSLDLINHMRDLGAKPAGLCGSGAAVFGFFDSQFAAQNAADIINAETFCVHTLTREESLRIS